MLTAGHSARLSSPLTTGPTVALGEGSAAEWHYIKGSAVRAVPDGGVGTKHCREITLSAEVGVGVVPGVLVVLENVQACGLRADRQTDRQRNERWQQCAAGCCAAWPLTLAYSIFSVQHPE